LLCSLWKTFASCSPTLFGMGELKRAIAREQEQFQRDRFASTLVIAASIICAVRLARDDIATPSPKVLCAVADSVTLAKMILKRVVG
jgi:hypothetical protein